MKKPEEYEAEIEELEADVKILRSLLSLSVRTLTDVTSQIDEALYKIQTGDVRVQDGVVN